GEGVAVRIGGGGGDGDGGAEAEVAAGEREGDARLAGRSLAQGGVDGDGLVCDHPDEHVAGRGEVLLRERDQHAARRRGDAEVAGVVGAGGGEGGAAGVEHGDGDAGERVLARAVGDGAGEGTTQRRRG